MPSGQSELDRLQSRLRELHAELAQVQLALNAPRQLLHAPAEPPRAEAHSSLDPHEALVQLIPQFVVIHQNGVVVYANDFVAQSLGYRHPDELLGRSVIDFIHPDDRPQVIQRVAGLLAGGPPAPPVVERILRRDGSIFEAEIAGALTVWNGRPAIQVVARDVSESLKARRAVEHLVKGTVSTGSDFFHDLTRSLGETLGVSHIFVVAWDKEDDVLKTLAHWHRGKSLLPTTYRRAGTPCELALAEGIYVCPRNAQEMFPQAQDLKLLGCESYFGAAIRNKSGEEVGTLCLLDDRPMENTEWLVPVVQAFALRAGAEFDRMGHERELTASEVRFRTLFENSHDAILLVDPHSLRVQMANLQAKQLLAEAGGYGSLVSAWNLEQALILDETDGCLAAVLRAAPADGAVRHTRAVLQGEHGRTIPCEVSVSRITIDRDMQVLLQLRDVRERHEAEQLTHLQNSILQDIAEGTALETTLTRLCQHVESILQTGLASVMLVNPDAQSLRLAVAPSLPPRAFDTLSSLAISPSGGSCASAAYYGTKSVVTDTRDDPRWAEAEWLVEQFGVRACWSMPFFIDGQVVGTFAISHLDCREPTTFETRVFESAAHLASVAVQRDHAFRQLMQREQRLRGILQTATDFIWSLDAEGRVRYYNRSITGEAPQIGEPLVEHLPDSWREPLDRAMQHVKRTNLPYQLEVKHAADESQRWFSFHVGPVEHEEQTVGFTICASETTSRKQMEEELRANLDRFRALAESAPAVIYLCDADGELTYVNSHWAELMDSERWSWRQSGALWEFIETYDRSRIQNQWRNCVAEGRRFESEYRMVTPQGRTKSLYHIAEPLRSPDGHCTGVVGFITDVTPVVDSAEKLRQRESELAHVSRLATMGQMVAELSHEINQPLYAISNYAAALRQHLGTSDDSATIAGPLEWADRIGKIAADAAAIIKRLRTFTTQPEAEFGIFDLGAAVGEAVSVLEWQLRAHGITLALEGLDLDSEMRGDRVAIQQVVVNLIKNASDALQEVDELDRRVIVRLQSDARYLRVDVIDNGPGIPEVRHPDELFRAFTSFKEGGSGMGLAVSRSIIERHHGQLSYKPNSPRGAIFGFRVPHAATHSRQPGR